MRAIWCVGFAIGLIGLTDCKMGKDAAVAQREPETTAAPSSIGMTGAAAGSGSMVADEPVTGLAEGKAGKRDGGGADKPRAETWKRSQVMPSASRVMVGDHEELALRALQTRVAIDGFRARVVTDYLYANDRDRQLEGTFQLRLPDEATPYFFAFGETAYAASDAPKLLIAKGGDDPDALIAERQQQSAWLEPKAARMVPRETAQIAYRETVNRRVDPALVEWAGAGVFSARVFPLAPHRLHRIVVGYDVDLTPIGDGLEYRLDLPAQVAHAVVDVSVSDALASDDSGKATAAGASSALVGGRRLFHFDQPRDHIAIRLPHRSAPLLVGADAATGSYFATRVTPELPAASAPASDSALFLVDTSLSANPDRFNVWLKLLRAVLDNNRGTLKQFNVLFFSVDAHWYKPALIANTPENVEALIAFANTLALEGATDLGAAIGQAAHPQWLPDGDNGARPDLFLLSDGAATWGESDLHAISRALDGAGRLFAYQTGLAGGDAAALVHLARETGGAVFSVTGEAEIAAAATAHRARSWRLVGVDIAGGRGNANSGASDLLVAGNPTALYPGQAMTVAGRGALAAGAQLVLTVEQNGVRQAITTPLAPPQPSSLAPRIYGQIATAHLEELEGATAAEARAYATHFRITGQTCSLLMLDSERDYERFGIHDDADAYVIKVTPAGPLFAQAIAKAAAVLGDPRARFTALIDRLQHDTIVHLDVPGSYRAAIAQVPDAAFAVPMVPLATQLRSRADVGSDLADQLARHALDYDAINAEADRRRAHGSPADALKALSSLVEDSPGDAVLARDVGFSAMALGLHAQAFQLLRRVADARPYEPETYRAMAHALAAMGKPDLAIAYYEIPLMGHWDARFGDLSAIARLDYLHFLRTLVAGDAPSSLRDYAHARIDALDREVGLGRADLVVTITWNTDNTDVDLHVVEPSGEECFYQHRHTRSGGQLTRDVTQGYGPEMYVLQHAPGGSYDIRAHYFASDRNRASVRTKVYATVFEDWGGKNERVSEKVIALETGKEMHAIARVDR